MSFWTAFNGNNVSSIKLDMHLPELVDRVQVAWKKVQSSAKKGIDYIVSQAHLLTNECKCILVKIREAIEKVESTSPAGRKLIEIEKKIIEIIRKLGSDIDPSEIPQLIKNFAVSIVDDIKKLEKLAVDNKGNIIPEIQRVVFSFNNSVHKLKIFNQVGIVDFSKVNVTLSKALQDVKSRVHNIGTLKINREQLVQHLQNSVKIVEELVTKVETDIHNQKLPQEVRQVVEKILTSAKTFITNAKKTLENSKNPIIKTLTEFTENFNTYIISLLQSTDSLKPIEDLLDGTHIKETLHHAYIDAITSLKDFQKTIQITTVPKEEVPKSENQPSDRTSVVETTTKEQIPSQKSTVVTTTEQEVPSEKDTVIETTTKEVAPSTKTIVVETTKEVDPVVRTIVVEEPPKEQNPKDQVTNEETTTTQSTKDGEVVIVRKVTTTTQETK